MNSAEIKMVRANLERRFDNVRRSRDGRWTACDPRKSTIKARTVRILLGDDDAALDLSRQYSR